MSNDDAGSDRGEPDMTHKDGGESDPDGKLIAQLLTSLADDPAAPPSSVTALSVIAAAKAAARAEPAASVDDQPIARDQPAEPGGSAPTADVIEFRPRRRRFAVAGLVAAASLAGITVLGISLTVSGGSSTSTSADGARTASAESPSSFDSPGAAELAQAPAAAAPSQPPGELQAAGAAPDTSAAAGGSGAAGPGNAGAGAAGSGPAADAAAGCWPALSDRALSALTDVLPPGEFGTPLPLTADCEPGAVGGAVVPGTAPGTVLVVRVTNSVPGACVSEASLGTPCVARGENLYVASDESGSPVVFAYGNGDQVVISGWPAAGDSVAVPAGLSVEQSVTAAEAVLDALV